jgi:transcriptional regulator with XRE-family HTH domain
MLGDNIRRVLNAKHMTSKELADALGVTPTYISYLLTNKRTPSYELLQEIARKLGVNIERLTGEAVSTIIDERLEELGMSLEALAEAAQVPPDWLRNLDDCVPGETDTANTSGNALEWDSVIGDYRSYTWITRVAEVLDLPPGRLRAALARQEPPAYEGEHSTPEEDFGPPAKQDALKTIAAHLEGKDITPQKLKLLEQYITVLFSDEEQPRSRR